MTAENPLTDVLASPLGPDWTVEGLAEQLLCAIAARRPEEVQEYVLDAEATTDRQSRRVLRPLLACLATKSAAETGTPPNLYGGRLSFQRPGPEGPVWIIGQFENRPGTVRVAFRRSSSPPQNSESRTVQPPVFTGADSRPDASQTATSRPADELPTRTRPDRSVLADKRRRAEVWVADYAKSAHAAASGVRGWVGASPHTFAPHIETMCYEIGKIYRDDWSHSDAEKLATTLRIHGGVATGGLAFIPGIGPLIGPLIGAILAPRGITEHRLLSASKLIIEYFDAPP